MDLTRITVMCFTASYAVALAIEGAGLAVRGAGWLVGRRLLVSGFAAAGLFAHVVYLALRASGQATPLSSPADWCLLAALVIAAVSLVATLTLPRWATGVFLLPVVLGLVAASTGASPEPFAPDRASRFWGVTHGWLLLAAAVTVSLGFAAGLMYLVQSWRLKNKFPPRQGFRLPSLEWLERVNSQSLGLSVWLVAGGFVSGLVLSTLKNRGVAGYQLVADPVVWTLGAMLAWLVVAEGFRLVYPAARRGQKVAYLTLASFGFLALVVLSLLGPTHRVSSDTPNEAPAPVEGVAGAPGVGRNDSDERTAYP
ncbi:MAG: cytochrome C assembly protein [Lacipirellulaceae bacterium]